MSPHTLTVPAAAGPPVLPPGGDGSAAVTLRTARPEDAAAMLALIDAHVEEGHLLPRALAELALHASRFVVGLSGGRVVACAELAPLSSLMAEVRSLVVHRDARHDGVGRAVVGELVRRARVQGFDTLSAFTHSPGYFVRLGFSLVPHQWMREKIAADCQSCALFRRCGQSAVALSLSSTARGGRPVRS